MHILYGSVVLLEFHNIRTGIKFTSPLRLPESMGSEIYSMPALNVTKFLSPTVDRLSLKESIYEFLN